MPLMAIQWRIILESLERKTTAEQIQGYLWVSLGLGLPITARVFQNSILRPLLYNLAYENFSSLEDFRPNMDMIAYAVNLGYYNKSTQTTPIYL